VSHHWLAIGSCVSTCAQWVSNNNNAPLVTDTFTQVTNCLRRRCNLRRTYRDGRRRNLHARLDGVSSS
jgi:hypothetical protein